MSEAFDLVVLGSGPAASRVATRCARADWSVAVVDPNPVGGTCALHGCNPKKVLVRAAELVDRARMMAGKGTQLGDARIDWPDLIRFKRQFTEPVTESKRESFTELGIQIFQARPRFQDRTTLALDGQTVTAKQILIATGAAPVELPFDGGELAITSDDFMQLGDLPERVVFVGGGYISFEFAHVAARAGAEVTVIEAQEPLAPFDRDLVRHLIDRSREIGIDIKLQTEVKSIKRGDDGTFVVAMSNEEGTQQVVTDLVVNAAGRVPNVNGLDLEQGNVRFDKRGIEVNEYFQSVSNPAVYAAGDVVASDLPELTPVANYQGRAVARNLLEGNVERNSNPVIPSAVFTVPALASVGMTESAARKANLSYELNAGDWAKFNSMKKVGETHARYKVLVDQESDKILGAHLLGPESPEVINVFALAMQHRIPASTLKRTPFVFPTFTSDISSML
ncbi:MAG: pyridine nucleotide-disulfide oxidoreductase [Planctomyces sp.]|nr:pyridine nucleotide-disulfide oxidoreductase [Planctomyces sp.]